MKIKKIILVALMFGTLITNANEKDNTNYKEAKKTVKVEFNNVKKGQTLTIKNSNGLTVYNNEIQNSGDYSKTFDFSALENGIYSAELNKDFEIVIKQFYVENGLVTFLNNKDEKIFKPIIRTEGELLLISKINFNNEPLKVTLYYNDEAVLSESISGDKLLKRVYKLSEKEVGAYKVVINSDQRTYTKEFKI
ncbi:hypothetical protein [Polaribacter sp. HaHaR_3_91]|jgi:hypothetical protein|uniref:hypothetical protein n=1 Tax=Polaribacter sp. HaHaR_3_91 TaxID=2745561 RepID=UPI001C4F2CBC|nr:hypothetical protein [Polaribacter sp. HaHaR_3_91]QXP63354.1 hypothetical protein H0I27_16180 [Polaribacter sp. HaHaR_3_91]